MHAKIPNALIHQCDVRTQDHRNAMKSSRHEHGTILERVICMFSALAVKMKVFSNKCATRAAEDNPLNADNTSNTRVVRDRCTEALARVASKRRRIHAAGERAGACTEAIATWGI